MKDKFKKITGLYDESFEKDSCGFGLISNIDNKPSHWLINTAITALERLAHRGAVGADGTSGDGCGILFKIPEFFFRSIANEEKINIAKNFAIGMFFLNPEIKYRKNSIEVVEKVLKEHNFVLAGWREVPVNKEICGEDALKTLPHISQAFVNPPENIDPKDIESKLLVIRRKIEILISKTNDNVFYITSFSSKVILYKGMIMPKHLAKFYLDLSNKKLETSLCVFHQRFSTNTTPQWSLAQPFRMLAHNGEINTIRANRNWSQARASIFKTSKIPELSELKPLVSMGGSDSKSLDNMLELLTLGGVDLFKAIKLLIPPAWKSIPKDDSDLKAFYEYNAKHMESWDGPAGIVLTDGRYAACVTDRNGLRPARYIITKDRHITVASEIGVYDYDEKDIVEKGKLGPGQIIAIDTVDAKILYSHDIDNILKKRCPYKEWMDRGAESMRKIIPDKFPELEFLNDIEIKQYEKMFNMTYEEKDQILKPLSKLSQEAIGSMGDDTPFPVLSSEIRSLYDYFRQQFAQVTNPPIDPIRESNVMSLETYLGPDLNVFEEGSKHAHRLTIESPILSYRKFKQLQELKNKKFTYQVLDLNYDADIKLKDAIINLTKEAIKAAKNNKVFIILSDKNIKKDKLPIHALLATGAVHHALIKNGLRTKINIIVETATARDSHHCATLIGYGATAIYPYLSYQSLNNMILEKSEHNSEFYEATRNYRQGINKGLYKILSKMGISTIASYRGSQLFECIGLNDEIVDLCFCDTTNRISGTTFDNIQSDQIKLAKTAWSQRKNIRQGGLLKYVHGEEFHAYNPDVVKTLQDAVKSGKYEDYEKYSQEVHSREKMVIRDMLDFKSSRKPIPLNEVEPIEKILLRFDSAGMSLGALSPDAHETLAQAMNKMGGRSNSGEGGEDHKRFGTDKNSKIKQVASGRFGVTPHYLVNAEVIQIKIAQGAKPGEGGQLPGDKVDKLIATLRYANPGITLISPPPHHDIYSIEDLAQLIFDLKQVNPNAFVSVKLVAEAGVGTIAAGVAKAYADFITISGYDGGTAASPLSSIKYAGGPWEMGLSETHQTLRANNLRKNVRLQADGGLKTGIDVIKAAILGAESFGFGTGPMIAMGCKYLRICHLNNCATGVATQNQVLRKYHFIGKDEMVINYFKFIAEETRRILASLGYKKLSDVIGQTDILEIKELSNNKSQNLIIDPIISDANVDSEISHVCQVDSNEPWDKAILSNSINNDLKDAIENNLGGNFNYLIKNTDRSVGASVSGMIARKHGNYGMSDNPINIKFKGTAGQSFGVWNAGGLNMILEGDANDYVGKGMAAGEIIVYPPKDKSYKAKESVIIGNTCMYGATGGKLYASGIAGERFAVRNSGATAIVEGVGDHGCEYMTNGTVIILGNTGINFGAGMSGGFAIVLDEDGDFK
ncbi:MAG: glutamate synthase large subunit, partial [Gammaproteobacteria bacterium]|nr:glutamate synthase large subunit [Gammaproteobacteria bacterium]